MRSPWADTPRSMMLARLAADCYWAHESTAQAVLTEAGRARIVEGILATLDEQ
ncbi:hypothetical protein [Corynebacterium nasicanis]|uniref:Uncharacterized protein n=1 Tax=Corynebacterium nasicanis TaxID=1448267 RepID=A0ABW1QC36_9CORY